jgi:hypothetical protein
MQDITSRDLRAAILDQVIAGAMRGKRYAYTAVLNDLGAWIIGIAVLNEPGYHPAGESVFCWDNPDEARAFCDAMNRHIGLTDDEAMRIVVSSMRRASTH